jgi:hypothetical protein
VLENRVISLLVIADNPFAEIFIIGGDYQLVARGIERVEAKVVPGIIKIKTRLGRFENEDIHLIDGDATIRVAVPRQISPIPIAGTAMTHDYQIAAAEKISKPLRVKAGRRAEIFLMARRWSSGTAEAGGGTGGSNPAAGMKLLDRIGRVVADFGARAVVDPDPAHDAWAACTVAVVPGFYLLRTPVQEGVVVDQVVFAPAGWQVQLFLLDASPAGANGAGSVGLSVLGNMGVSMAKLGNGFRGTDAFLAQADLVRIALADDRPVFSNAVASLLVEMLHDKFDNPMLGIYGAHLMLMGRDYVARQHDLVGEPLQSASFAWVSDDNLYDEVIVNLRSLLGNHNTDVEALSLKCGNEALRARKAVAVPPMLRRSWSLLVEASNTNAKLVSLALWERIATMVPAGPFLTWRPQRKARVRRRRPFAPHFEEHATLALTSRSQSLVRPSSGKFVRALAADASPRPSPALKAIAAAFPTAVRESLTSEADRGRFALELDVPRAAIDRVLDRRRT